MDQGSQVDFDLLLKGNRNEWEAFVRRVSPVVFSVIKKTLVSAGRDTEEAQDILQELFARLCANNFQILKRYDPERARLTTWLSVIARNMTIDYLRRFRYESFEQKDMADTSHEDNDERMDSQKVLISFDLLPERQMLLMKLLYEKGLSVKDVASFMGVTEQTVRSMRHKAIQKLRNILDKG